MFLVFFCMGFCLFVFTVLDFCSIMAILTFPFSLPSTIQKKKENLALTFYDHSCTPFLSLLFSCLPLSVLFLWLHYHHFPSGALRSETHCSVLFSVTPFPSILHFLTSELGRWAEAKSLPHFTSFLLHFSFKFLPLFFFLQGFFSLSL